MFISNNRASFHLCCKENLIKHKKVSKYSRHPLSRAPKGAAKKFEIVNVRNSEKSKNKQTNTNKQKACISHTRKYINLTCNTLRSKIETKGTLLGEKSKIA